MACSTAAEPSITLPWSPSSRTGTPSDGRSYATPSKDRAYSIEASTVINATGAWADQVREMDQPGRPAMVRLSKGTHLVLARDDVPLNVSCVFPSPLDDRHLFLIRRDDCFLYGTTDGWHDGSPDDPRPGEVDTEYLLEAIRRFFPGSSLTRSSVLYCYSGYRALPSPKANRNLPWSVGRDDMVEVAQSGLATVVSGKLTTSRSLAERVLDRLTEGADGMDRWSACRTDRVAIGGADPADAAGPEARASPAPGASRGPLKDSPCQVRTGRPGDHRRDHCRRERPALPRRGPVRLPQRDGLHPGGHR